jgi:hypothetical protein
MITSEQLILQTFINKMSEECNVILFFIFKPLLLVKRREKKGSGIDMKNDLRN